MKRNRFCCFSFDSLQRRWFVALLVLCFLNLNLSPYLWAASSPESKTSNQETPGASDSSAGAVLLAVYSSSLPSSDLKKVSAAVAKSLKESTPYQFLSSKEIEKRLEASSSGEAFLTQVEDSIAQAHVEYYEAHFEKAISILQNSLAQSGAFDMTPALQMKVGDVYFKMASIFDPQVRSKDIWAACVNSVVADPTRNPDPSRSPSYVISNVAKAKEEYQKMTGAISVDTHPPDAKVFFGKQALGTTPGVFKDLPLGVQSIRIQKDGYKELERKVFVALESEGNKPIPVWVDLARKGRSDSQVALANLLSKKTSYEAQVSEMALLGRRMGVDQVFSARVEQGMSGMELYLLQVDAAQSKGVGKAFAQGLNISDLNREVPAAVSAMQNRTSPVTWTDVIAVGGVETDYGMKAPKEKKPFYKKWPFYLAIGVVVAGAGAGTALMLGGGGSKSGPVTISSPPP